MKRSTKKSLYKIFVSLFVVFYTFFPQSIVIGQVIDEVSQENAAPIEVVQDVIPQEDAAPTEEVVPENNITEVKEEIPQEKPLWLVDGNTAVTSNPVELDKEYTAPQNDKVKIIFTKLPDNPSSVKIKEITLTEEEIKVSGAVSDKAYDITADMIDGTFEYDLVLPSVKDGIKVVYAEDRDSILTDLKEVDNTIVNEGDSIKIEDLKHFTIFIATYHDDVQVTYIWHSGLDFSTYCIGDISPKLSCGLLVLNHTK
ncbi:MAG TPA: hypothetical protein PLK49_02720 [Candidatus Dojkabacteria bacterium]|nr:hypothetical protein [Candidatus Dojkabacteria bacterium]